MKYIIILTTFILLFTQQSVSSTKNGYLIKTKLHYTGVENKKISASKEFILTEDNTGWVTLTDLQDGVVLLGRLAKAENDWIQMEYLLVDGSQKPNGVVSAPRIVAKLNHPAEISIGGEKQPTLSVSLTAQKAEYTQK